MLSKALPIFLIATFSPVTEFTAALKFKNQESMNIHKKAALIIDQKKNQNNLPDNTASASTNGTNRRDIFSGYFKELSINVVLNISATVCRYNFDAMIGRTRA